MTREEARELFSAAFDAELDAASERALRAALEADPELAHEYAEFRATLERMRAAPPASDAPDLLPGVQRRLRQRSRGRYYADRFSERLGLGAWQPVVLAIVMLALLGLAWLGLSVLQHIRLG